jgi:hypothetical protein
VFLVYENQKKKSKLGTKCVSSFFRYGWNPLILSDPSPDNVYGDGSFLHLKNNLAGSQWLVPINVATWDTEIGKITVLSLAGTMSL